MYMYMLKPQPQAPATHVTGHSQPKDEGIDKLEKRLGGPWLFQLPLRVRRAES